jgi:hypothetical protein
VFPEQSDMSQLAVPKRENRCGSGAKVRRGALPAPTRAIQAVVLAVCVASGCAAGPKITRFDATPRVLCEGQRTVLRWEADGELAMALLAEPGETAEEECASTGQDVLALTLVASKKNEESERKVEVVQLHQGATEPVVFRVNDLSGTDVVASGEKNVALWGDQVEVATVAACGRRAILVEHAGKTALLSADGTPSNTLAHTAFGGAWKLRSPLTPDEQRNPSLRPKQLKILATVRCRPEAP